jgi:hypothetical protein
MKAAKENWKSEGAREAQISSFAAFAAFVVKSAFALPAAFPPWRRLEVNVANR